jgi:hypothetical protein
MPPLPAPGTSAAPLNPAKNQTGSGGAGPNTSQQSTHEIFVTILAEVIGVSLLAILADASDSLGKVAVALMAGWLLLFLISNATDLSTWAAKL